MRECAASNVFVSAARTESALHPSLFRRSKSLELTGPICRGGGEPGPGISSLFAAFRFLSREEGGGGEGEDREKESD